MAEAGVGCYIGKYFRCFLSYADDIVLLVLQLGLCDLFLVSVIIMRWNIRFCSMPKNINVFHLAHIMAIYLLRKMYQHFLLEDRL